MQNLQPKFNRKKLVIAVSIAMLGGTLAGCDNSNDPIAPDALGDYSILANGGTGGNVNGSNGGSGGGIALSNTDGSTGGVDILQRGTANTSFTTPLKPGAANLGDNPLAITENTTLDLNFVSRIIEGNVTVLDVLYVGTDDVLRVGTGLPADYTTDELAPAGTYYVSSSELYLSDGATPAVAFTGLSVSEGATLTLKNSISGISLTFSEDIDNSGTITRDLANPSTYINLYARHYIASGNIANAGIDAADGNPNGGSVYIHAVNGISNNGAINASGFDDTDSDDAGGGGYVTLDSNGYVINSGPIDVSGGDAPGTGGYGGEVYMYAAYTESTGDIDASGGNNTSPEAAVLGNGGDGGEVDLGSDFITVNTANIDNSGGDGSDGGSSSLYVNIYNEDIGEVKNAGNINMNGGNGITDTGGYGGELSLMSSGGDALNSGNVTATGGDSAFGGGGSGGDIYANANHGDGFDAVPGDVEVSGNINLSGGNGLATDGSGDGGSSGYMALSIGGGFFPLAEAPSDDADGRVALLGYVSIDANGGDGANGGDAGGLVAFTQTYSSADEDDEEVEEGTTYGSITNDVPINARGANSIASATELGEGGDGGEVSMFASTDLFDPSGLDSEATNTAAIDLSGGDAVNDLEALSSYSAGDGGDFDLVAAANANNSGAINANGGAGDSSFSDGDGGDVDIAGITGESSNSGELMLNGGNGAESGGDGGDASIYGGAGATNSGVIAANGGTGAYDGGDGGSADIGGATSSNKADISVNGGNATTIDAEDLTIATGGDGGWIDLWGQGLDTVTNTGTLSYLFGTGEEDGDEGHADVGIVCEGNCN